MCISAQCFFLKLLTHSYPASATFVNSHHSVSSISAPISHDWNKCISGGVLQTTVTNCFLSVMGVYFLCLICVWLCNPPSKDPLWSPSRNGSCLIEATLNMSRILLMVADLWVRVCVTSWCYCAFWGVPAWGSHTYKHIHLVFACVCIHWGGRNQTL